MPQDFDLLSDLAKDATLNAVKALIGEIAADPTANTVQDRLKQLKAAIESLSTQVTTNATTNKDALVVALSALADALKGADAKTLSDLYGQLGLLLTKVAGGLPAALDGGRLSTQANLAFEGGAVTSSRPLPVDVGANIDLGNVTVSFQSTILATPQFATPFAANEERATDWFDVKDYAAIKVLILTDQYSAINGALVEFTEDTANGALRSTPATVPPGVGLSFGIPRLGRYVRFRYTNGVTPQVVPMRISVLASFTTLASAQLPLGATITDANIAGTVAAMNFGRLASGQWKGLEITTEGWQKIHLAADGVGLSLEATQQLIKAALDVNLSTRASEATLAGVKSGTDNLDLALSTVRDSLVGGASKSMSDLDTALTTINNTLRAQMAIAASLWTDDSGAYYVRRDSVNEGTGVVTVYFTDATGTTVTPGAGLRPLASAGKSLEQVLFDAVNSGTGYVAGDVLARVMIVDPSTTPPAVSALWMNVTQGTQLASPPANGDFIETTRNINVASGTLTANIGNTNGLALDSTLLARASEATAAGIKTNTDKLDIALSALRDALLGIDSKTLSDLASLLSTVAGKDFATQATLAQVKNKTDNLDLGISALRDALIGVNSKTLSDLATVLGTINSKDFATETTQAKRLGGDKIPKTVTATTIGATTIHTPASGKRIVVYWVSAINDPTASTPTIIKIKLGTTELYRAWAVAHWEEFTGGVDEPLTIELSAPGNVLVTAHIKEI